MRQESKDNMLLRATEAAEELLKVRNNERLFDSYLLNALLLPSSKVNTKLSKLIEFLSQCGDLHMRTTMQNASRKRGESGH